MKRHRIAGLVLVGTSSGFIAVFSYLAARFGYPEVLDGTAAEVLPALLAGGAAMRAVWAIYAALPLGIAVAAALAYPFFRPADERVARIGRGAAFATAVAMTIGLARWSTIHTVLAERFVIANAAEREQIAALFDSLNLYLGNVIGEFIGELSISLWFGTISIAILRARALPRWLGYVGGFTAVSMTIGAFRNLTTLVAPVAALNNNLLPLWLIALGVALYRSDAASVSSFAAERRNATNATDTAHIRVTLETRAQI